MSKVMPTKESVACGRCKTRMAAHHIALRKGYRRVCEKCLRGEEKRRLSRYPNQHQYKKENNHAPEDKSVRPQEEGQGAAEAL